MQLSADPSTPADSLLPVPTFLFQGSILLGSVCESVLGVSASGKQLVHPFLIAGWCGLFTQVLLPLLLLACVMCRLSGVQCMSMLCRPYDGLPARIQSGCCHVWPVEWPAERKKHMSVRWRAVHFNGTTLVADTASAQTK